MKLMRSKSAYQGTRLSLDEFLLEKARSAPPPSPGTLQELVERKTEDALQPTIAHPPAPGPLDILPQEVASEVKRRWGHFCEEMFEYLADNHPCQLLRLMVKARIPAADLTFAAEIAGRINDSAAVRPILLLLLKHRDAVVREGVLYGLARHIDDEVTAKLREIAAGDPSPAVRTTAADLLEQP